MLVPKMTFPTVGNIWCAISIEVRVHFKDLAKAKKEGGQFPFQI